MPAQNDKPVSAAEARALFGDLKACPALLLAVSGGPDSTALMWLAARWRDALKKKPKLVAVTVDHGLRKEAKAEAAAVARLARKLKIAHRTVRWRGAKPATGLQQAARAARYRLLADAAHEAGASHILTAHTLDDQAETVLIRMSRGSGIAGLAAMAKTSPLPTVRRAPSPLEGEGWGGGSSSKNLPPSRRASHVDLPLKGGGERVGAARDEILLIRPLLDIPKARLVATLRAAKIPHADDPSNRDPRFTRARLRMLMPHLAEEGLDARRLAVLARRLKRADAAIDTAGDRAGRELAVDMAAPARIVMEARRFSELPDEIGLRLIGRAVTRLGDEGPVELGKLEALKEALDAAQAARNGTFRRSLAGALVSLSGGLVTVERAPPRQQKSLTTAGGGRAKRRKGR